MSKSLFDHLNAIYLNKKLNYFDQLDETDKKSFNVYMINRFLSMNPNYVSIVNELQQYWDSIGSREAYLFYSQIIPGGRQFSKYIKGKTEGKNNAESIDLISKHYQISRDEADEYVSIASLSDEGKEWIDELFIRYGIEVKKNGRGVRRSSRDG